MWIAYPIIRFWLYHPALLYGIAFLLGVYCCLAGPVAILIPSLFLWLPFLLSRTIKPLILSLFIFLTAWSYVAISYTFPQLPKEGVQGTAQVKVKNISLQTTLFGERWLYRCELKQFFPLNETETIASSIPCIISLSKDALRPLANQEYWIEGKLKQSAQGAIHLKVSKKAVWKEIEGTWSWAEKRYQWKKMVNQWIESKFSHSMSGSFLAGLATGEFDDSWMRQQFARFGLQHLLAISGFHFAIVAGFLSFILRFFLSHHLRLITLLICLGGYCFFLGPQASILRAWIMCSLALAGSLFEKQATALNSLGFAILAILCIDPLFLRELGFQLSFGTTAAILLFYRPAKSWLDELFPKRGLSEVITMNHLNQYGYCILAFLRESLALALAVNAFAIPLTLYYFNQFPLMSLLYNLFFPLLAAGSICLLLLGALVSFLPFVASFIHAFNNAYTLFILQLTYQIPSEMDSYLELNTFHPNWLVIYLCLATLGAILWKEYSKENQQSEFFTFI